MSWLKSSKELGWGQDGGWRGENCMSGVSAALSLSLSGIPAFAGMTKRPERGLMESSPDFVGVIYFGL